ncbi:MAG: DUF444 family protein [Alicyclobacillus macrosporangiidus]|uniref:DUF444 family protein n=1 Tax=Alicyclobacillus macrosporangiidus TaxID=392015 RepID=UPI0026F0C0A8|nr:DUF444 family protein [Alicyclobacillus macrosporangiidus]MCL6598280.1 DUF444 family protein [Alicyclobacillus macrosporangiidus]
MSVVTHDDWSLDRRGQSAQARHREKIKQAIRENLADLVSDQGIILSDGKRTVRIPVPTLDEPHFRFDYNKQQHVGQGEGKPGQSIGRVGGLGQGAGGPSGQGTGPGASGAGDQPGEQILEAEVSIEDIEDALFADLRLPNLKDKPPVRQVTDGVDFTDVRPRGIQANIDRKRTFLQALRRSRLAGQKLTITKEDLRFKTWEETQQPGSGAVVIAMMDVSGSMGMSEKYMARTFFFWTEKFLRRQYQNVEIRYLVHHAEAYETTKEAFYTTRENGGTVCSTVFQLALELVRCDYPPELWNIYPLYVGDGDNHPADNERAVKVLQDLCAVSAMTGYVEINPYNRVTALSRHVAGLDPAVFRWATAGHPRDMLKIMRAFFRADAAASREGA